jgi:hypothetical protein
MAPVPIWHEPPLREEADPILVCIFTVQSCDPAWSFPLVFPPFVPERSPSYGRTALSGRYRQLLLAFQVQQMLESSQRTREVAV